MSIVNVVIANANYQLACEDGQEEHLQELTNRINQRVQGIADSLRRPVDSKILAMAALMLEDEVNELQKKAAAAPAPAPAPKTVVKEDNAVYEAAMDTVADRIEALAKRLEKR